MIRFSNVSKVYKGGKCPALQGIHFHLPIGSMTYLTGHSGAGKSTLLKLIMAIEHTNIGKIWFQNHDITRLNLREVPFLRRQIGMVHQNYRLLNDRNTFDNVSLPLIINGMHPNEIKRRVSSMLDKVGLLNKAHYYPSQLSGGEQQRVDIARAMVNRPQLLLADEPTGNLDESLSLDIFRLFEDINRIGVTVLIATHNHTLIQKKPRPILTLNNGRLVTP